MKSTVLPLGMGLVIFTVLVIWVGRVSAVARNACALARPAWSAADRPLPPLVALALALAEAEVDELDAVAELAALDELELLELHPTATRTAATTASAATGLRAALRAPGRIGMNPSTLNGIRLALDRVNLRLIALNRDSLG